MILSGLYVTKCIYTMITKVRKKLKGAIATICSIEGISNVEICRS